MSNLVFDAGFAMMTFNINSDCQHWVYRDEKFKTLCIPTMQHQEPFIKVARIEDVRSNALG